MDIVERLRNTGCDREPFTPDHAHCKCRLASEAAKEIERLRAANAHAAALVKTNFSHPNAAELILKALAS